MIDLEELRTRLFAAPSYVPGIVYLLLYTIAAEAIRFSGYAVALEGKQGRVPYVILGALVAIVIADIDRPWGGFVKVSQQPILDLQTSLPR